MKIMLKLRQSVNKEYGVRHLKYFILLVLFCMSLNAFANVVIRKKNDVEGKFPEPHSLAMELLTSWEYALAGPHTYIDEDALAMNDLDSASRTAGYRNQTKLIKDEFLTEAGNLHTLDQEKVFLRGYNYLTATFFRYKKAFEEKRAEIKKLDPNRPQTKSLLQKLHADAIELHEAASLQHLRAVETLNQLAAAAARPVMGSPTVLALNAFFDFVERLKPLIPAQLTDEIKHSIFNPVFDQITLGKSMKSNEAFLEFTKVLNEASEQLTEILRTTDVRERGAVANARMKIKITAKDLTHFNASACDESLLN